MHGGACIDEHVVPIDHCGRKLFDSNLSFEEWRGMIRGVASTAHEDDREVAQHLVSWPLVNAPFRAETRCARDPLWAERFVQSRWQHSSHWRACSASSSSSPRWAVVRRLRNRRKIRASTSKAIQFLD